MLKTPYYLIDKQKLLVNLQKIARLRELSGAKALLALKCFATWSVFDLMREVSRSRGTTVLLVTHNHALAGQCDRIVELVDGRIVGDRRV